MFGGGEDGRRRRRRRNNGKQEMEVEEKFTVRELYEKKRILFCVADLAINTKRSGADKFKDDELEVDELAAALAQDAKLGKKKRKKKATG